MQKEVGNATFSVALLVFQELYSLLSSLPNRQKEYTVSLWYRYKSSSGKRSSISLNCEKMETKGIKVTNKKQFEAMVEWMERHADFARGKGHFGSSKQQFKEQEEELAQILNSFGPPTRAANDWNRVWINFKSNVKKKLSNNRQNSAATGGGISMAMALSPLEETVANLIHAPLIVNPPGISLGGPGEAEDNTNNVNVEEFPSTSRHEGNTNDVNVEELPSTSRQSNEHQRKPIKRRNRLDERIRAINRQSVNQKIIIGGINRIDKTLYKMYELQKKKIKTEEEYRKLKTEIAKKQLELLNMQLGNNQ